MVSTGAASQHRQWQNRLDEAVQPVLNHKTDASTYIAALKRCGRERDLKEGKRIHSKLCESEYGDSRFFQNMVMEMYGKCGSRQDAYGVFESMRDRNVVSWNIMAAALAKNGYFSEAVELFCRMLCEGIRAESVAYLTALEACVGLRCEKTGRRVHQMITESGYHEDLVVANSLINMYGRCGDLKSAQRVFDGLVLDRDVISWNCLLTAYARNGYPTKVIGLFQHNMDVKPDNVTYVLALNACASLAALSQGRMVHRCIEEDVQLQSDTVVWNALLNMYGKCKSVEDAASVFNSMVDRNVISWTGMISVFAQNGESWQALKLFKRMDLEGVQANLVTFVSVLDACAAVGGVAGLQQGRHLHARILHAGLKNCIILGNSLMNMYTKCGSSSDAQELFKELHHNNLVAWNTLLTMYVNEERNSDALELLPKMDQEGVKPDSITYLNLVTAATPKSPGCQLLVSRITSQGMESDVFVGNALLMLHCKSSELDKARQVFDKIQRRSVVAWTTMVCGYADNGLGREALTMFREMDLEGVEPDKVTFTAVVDACASLPCLAEGKAVHSRIVDNGTRVNTQLGNALVNMYGRCGSLQLARATFNGMDKDLVSWNTMLAALAQNGHGRETVERLKEMNLEGVVPNDITLLVVIFGCGNAGMLDRGETLLKTMEADFGVAPQVNHYGCLIDLLGKAGWVERAENLVAAMPMPADGRAWQTLLAACNTQGDVERAAKAAMHVTQILPLDDAPYVSLSNVYKSSKRQSSLGSGG